MDPLFGVFIGGMFTLLGAIIAGLARDELESYRVEYQRRKNLQSLLFLIDGELVKVQKLFQVGLHFPLMVDAYDLLKSSRLLDMLTIDLRADLMIIYSNIETINYMLERFDRYAVSTAVDQQQRDKIADSTHESIANIQKDTIPRIDECQSKIAYMILELNKKPSWLSFGGTNAVSNL